MGCRERETFHFEMIGRELSGRQKVITLLSVLGRSCGKLSLGAIFIGVCRKIRVCRGKQEKWLEIWIMSPLSKV